MTIWIQSGTVVDPVTGLKEVDVVVERGKIAEIHPPGKFRTSDPKVRTVNASGKWVLPGLIDMHVHLREPGHEYKETIQSGSRAGAKGGFTSLACMPNTAPPNDCRSVTEFILEQGERAKCCRIYPVAAISAGQRGEVLTEFGDLRDAGATAVSDDGFAVANSELMRRALEYAAYHGLMVISHSEDASLSRGGAMHEGAVSTRVGLPGIPAASEEIMVYRDICLAKLTGCPVHLAHVSTAGSVDLIRKAKETGVRVTAETAPHYFSLDHSAVLGYDTRAKVNPPLRTAEDVQAVRQGLADGVIDVIATDHAPHSPLEKEVEFDQAAFGMIGLETALPLSLELVREGILELPDMVGKLSSIPAKILDVPGGRLETGAQADLIVVDPGYEFVLRAEEILSKSKNSPFIGKTLRGSVEITIMGGKIVWKRDDA